MQPVELQIGNVGIRWLHGTSFSPREQVRSTFEREVFRSNVQTRNIGRNGDSSRFIVPRPADTRLKIERSWEALRTIPK